MCGWRACLPAADDRCPVTSTSAAASLVLRWLPPLTLPRPPPSPATLMLHMCHCRRRWRASAGSGLTVTRTLLPVSHSDSSAGLKMKPWCPRRRCVASTVPPLRHRGLEGRNLCSLFGHSFFFFLYWCKLSSCIAALIMVFIPVVSLASKHDDDISVLVEHNSH